MNENNINNNNIPGKVQPVAKTAATRPASAQPVTPVQKPESDGVDLFSSVYNEQKTMTEQQTLEFVIAKNLNEQKRPASPVKTPVAPATIPVVDPKKNLKKAEEDKKFNTIFIILIILTVVIFLASTGFLLFKMFKPAEEETPGTITTIPTNTVSASLESPFNYQKVYNVTFPEGMKEEFKDLYAQNQEFAGWIKIDGTCIDFPVYYNDDTYLYYLKRSNYGTYTKYGVPFLDMECDPVNLSRNTVVHAHNFGEGLLFDDLHKFADIEFVKQYPIIEFSTLYKDYKFKVIGAFHTNGSSKGDNDYLFYYIAADFGEKSLMKFHDEILQRSHVHTGVDVQPTDKLITLSTCTYFFDVGGALQDARFAVIGRLVRDGESEEIDTSLVKANDNVRYPQLYYNVFGGSNPWVNASKWVPEAE